MAWYSWLTGNSDIAEKVVDSSIAGLDMMFHTNEEKSIASQKILDWKLEYVKATAGQSIARRIIATIITVQWLLMLNVAIIAQGFEAVEFSKYVFEMMKENVNTPFSIVVGFYFLAYITKGIKK